MLHTAVRLSELTADMLRPTPAWTVDGATDAHSTDSHELEASEAHLAHFIGLLESFQDHLTHAWAHIYLPGRTQARPATAQALARVCSNLGQHCLLQLPDPGFVAF